MPVARQQGACLSPVKTVTLSGDKEIQANGYHVLPHYAERTQLEVKEYIWLPFGWNSIFRRDYSDGEWEAGLNTDLMTEARVFETIGFVPYHPFQGYCYHIRPGSICHNPQAPYNVLQEYKGWLERIARGERFGLSAPLVEEMKAMLAQRCSSIERYLADAARNELQYLPQVMLDMMLYPDRS